MDLHGDSDNVRESVRNVNTLGTGFRRASPPSRTTDALKEVKDSHRSAPRVLQNGLMPGPDREVATVEKAGGKIEPRHGGHKIGRKGRFAPRVGGERSEARGASLDRPSLPTCPSCRPATRTVNSRLPCSVLDLSNTPLSGSVEYMLDTHAIGHSS